MVILLSLNFIKQGFYGIIQNLKQKIEFVDNSWKYKKIILNKKFSKPNSITVKINENTVSMATRLWLQSKTSVKQYILHDCLPNPLIQKFMLYQGICKMVPESGVIFIAD